MSAIEYILIGISNDPALALGFSFGLKLKSLRLDNHRKEVPMKKMFFAVTTAFATASAVAAMPLDGKALFQDNCARCHGEGGKGGAVMPLVGDASQWSLKLFQRAVLTGVDEKGRPLKSPMPHWRNASFETYDGKAPSRAEVAAIYRYLRTVK